MLYHYVSYRKLRFNKVYRTSVVMVVRVKEFDMFRVNVLWIKFMKRSLLKETQSTGVKH